MAKETSRTFDTQLGSVIVVIQDGLGNDTYHTISLTAGDVDVDAMVAQLITESDARTAILRERMIAAGWSDQG